jgi:hypothetical protein
MGQRLLKRKAEEEEQHPPFCEASYAFGLLHPHKGGQWQATPVQRLDIRA